MDEEFDDDIDINEFVNSNDSDTDKSNSNDSDNESNKSNNESKYDKDDDIDDKKIGKITFKRKKILEPPEFEPVVENDLKEKEDSPEDDNKMNRMEKIMMRNSLTSKENTMNKDRMIKESQSLPWIEKYRPSNLSEVISHDSKVEVLTKLIEKRQLPHLLFYGQSGTGKTSTMIALAKQMYGVNYKRYILELNASDDRGIEIVRTKIPTFAQTKTDDLRFVILDEADAMTVDAQSALRRIMELYIKNCRFCLICNNINKILPGIQSRCAKMRFGVLDRGSIKGKLIEIIKKENIMINDDAIDELLEIQQDFRQILNTLQCLRSIRFEEIIRREDVTDYLGKPNNAMVKKIINILETEPFKKAYAYMIDLHRENRISMIDLIQNIVNFMIDRDDISEERRSKILDGLANVEYRMITGSDSEIQLASLVGVMIANRAN